MSGSTVPINRMCSRAFSTVVTLYVGTSVGMVLKSFLVMEPLAKL